MYSSLDSVRIERPVLYKSSLPLLFPTYRYFTLRKLLELDIWMEGFPFRSLGTRKRFIMKMFILSIQLKQNKIYVLKKECTHSRNASISYHSIFAKNCESRNRVDSTQCATSKTKKTSLPPLSPIFASFPQTLQDI